MAHTHKHRTETLNRAFTIGIVLNLLFVGMEFGAGVYFNSLGLISDAGHNLSDVIGLALALMAFRLSDLHAPPCYTYGFKKSTVLASLFNAVILFVAVGFIIRESVEKFFEPQEVDGCGIAFVAGVGVLINGLTAWLFVKDKNKDLNIKGAYLHMAADALVSVGVLISGLAIRYTSWYLIDPLIGLIVALVIIYSTWGLLRDSVRLSLDAVPTGTNLVDIENTCLSIDSVRGIHHLHIWAISTTETALTAHIVVNEVSEMESVKKRIKEDLGKLGISHVTLETELPNSACGGMECRSHFQRRTFAG
ncbi:MAG: cation diffusion facilitator family transporter [Tannerellaceae bacterium]|jgi:cobalt-zinc-cadmium efflux system protein|nr:cation diffusion facilitator family transporter [Tannerellaceae bacterium]